MIENNDLLSLWYGYILKNWLYFEESDDVKVSEDGKRASSLNVNAMKVAIKAKRNPTTEEREADVFFRRTVEIPDTVNSDKCHILQEAGQFSYYLVINEEVTFPPCYDLERVETWVRNNLKEYIEPPIEGYVSNPTGIRVTPITPIELPNLTNEAVTYYFRITTDNVPDGIVVSYTFPPATEECTTSNTTHAVTVIERDYCIEYDDNTGEHISYSESDSDMGCNGGSVDFRKNQDACYGGEVLFKLKLKGFKAKLSDDEIRCGRCGDDTETTTNYANANISINPANVVSSYTNGVLDVRFGSSQSSIGYDDGGRNIGCDGGNVTFTFNGGEGSSTIISPDKTLDGCNGDNVNFSVRKITSECVDECTINITWVDGVRTTEKIWPLTTGRSVNRRMMAARRNIIEVLPNNF